jgi:alkylation response protein AidB-like acyl-CoA dehydrogenase
VLAAAISERGQDLTRPGTVARRTESGWRIDGRKMFCTMSPAATDLYVAVTYADGEGIERSAYAMVPTDAPGVVVHDDWDALGMRASGSNSISLDGVELPESGVRGGFRAGDPLPYMERNLLAGLFHAAASLGIAESADAIARRNIAGRINGDARPRMQVADNAVDLAASRGVLSRAAALIDEHRAASTEMALAAPTHPAPPQDAHSFRDALAKFATGVAFVTAAPDGKPTGLIVNSLTSVSLEPPLVSFCPSRSSLTWSRIRRAGRFGVNVLGPHHEQFARRATPAGADRFAGLDWELVSLLHTPFRHAGTYLNAF